MAKKTGKNNTKPRPLPAQREGINKRQLFEKAGQEIGLTLSRHKENGVNGSTWYFYDSKARTTVAIKVTADGSLKGPHDPRLKNLYEAVHNRLNPLQHTPK